MVDKEKQEKSDPSKGQLSEHPMTRTNPETGETESQPITNQRWRAEGKALRAQGWTRDAGDDESGDESGDAVE